MTTIVNKQKIYFVFFKQLKVEKMQFFSLNIVKKRIYLVCYQKHGNNRKVLMKNKLSFLQLQYYQDYKNFTPKIYNLEIYSQKIF